MGALYVGPVVDPAAVAAAASAEASGNQGIGASAFLAAGGTKPRRAARDANVGALIIRMSTWRGGRKKKSDDTVRYVCWSLKHSG